MKILTSIFAIFALTNIAFSQSLTINWMDSDVQKNFITTDPDSLAYSYKATAKGEMTNNTFGALKLISSVKFIEKAPNHSIGYCTKICYSAFDEDFVETMPYTLEAGQSTNSVFRGTDGSDGFQIYLYPFAPDELEDVRYPGTTIIRMRFMNYDNQENDFIEFDIKFEISVDGVSSVELGKPGEFTLYPNPANDRVKLNISDEQESLFVNSNVKIYDLLGNKVLEFDNYNANQELNIANLTPGRYIQAITNSEGKVFSLPLIKN